MNSTRKKKKSKRIVWILVILLGIILIIILFASAGKINLFKEKSKEVQAGPDKTKQIHLKSSYKRLEEKIEKEVKLKRRLNISFIIIYLSVRVFFVAIIVAFNFYLYKVQGIRTIGDFVDWNEAILFVILIILFVITRRPLGVNNWLEKLEKQIKVWIYGKYLEIDEKIYDDKNKLKDLSGSV
jgi:H+/gluconate symporter-like permease